MSGAAGREGEAADPRGPHLASGGRKSGSVSSGSSGVMPAAAEHPRTVAARASAATAAGGANDARTRPQPELTNRSTEPVAKLTGPNYAPAAQVRVGGACCQDCPIGLWDESGGVAIRPGTELANEDGEDYLGVLDVYFLTSVMGGGDRVPVQVRSQLGFLLPPCGLGHWDRTDVVRLGGKHLYQQAHVLMISFVFILYFILDFFFF